MIPETNASLILARSIMTMADEKEKEWDEAHRNLSDGLLVVRGHVYIALKQATEGGSGTSLGTQLVKSGTPRDVHPSRVSFHTFLHQKNVVSTMIVYRNTDGQVLYLFELMKGICIRPNFVPKGMLWDFLLKLWIFWYEKSKVRPLLTFGKEFKADHTMEVNQDLQEKAACVFTAICNTLFVVSNNFCVKVGSESVTSLDQFNNNDNNQKSNYTIQKEVVEHLVKCVAADLRHKFHPEKPMEVTPEGIRTPVLLADGTDTTTLFPMEMVTTWQLNPSLQPGGSTMNQKIHLGQTRVTGVPIPPGVVVVARTYPQHLECVGVAAYDLEAMVALVVPDSNLRRRTPIPREVPYPPPPFSKSLPINNC